MEYQTTRDVTETYQFVKVGPEIFSDSRVLPPAEPVYGQRNLSQMALFTTEYFPNFRITVLAVTSCFVYKVIRKLNSIEHLYINPIRRIGLIHK